MSSWHILRRLFDSWGAKDNPIFNQAIRYEPTGYSIIARLSRMTGLVLVGGGLTCYGVTLALFLVGNLLVLALPLVITWNVILGLSLGPTIAGERQRGTWVLLRTTPLPLDRVVLGKLSGALWWLRDLVRAAGGALLLVAVGLGMVTMAITPSGGDSMTGSPLPGGVLCVAVFLVPVLSAAIYTVDRVQQFALMITTPLLVSATTRTVTGSLTGGAAIALGTWLLDAAIAAGVIIMQPGYELMTLQHWLALLVFGPVVGYLDALPLPLAVLMIGGTLIMREMAFRVLWRGTLRSAAVT